MSKETVPTEDNRKLVGPLAILVSLVLAAGFFLFMCKVAYAHTPDFSERGRQITAAFTSFCLTMVFWMVLQGFWVTLVDQMRRKKAGIKS